MIPFRTHLKTVSGSHDSCNFKVGWKDFLICSLFIKKVFQGHIFCDFVPKPDNNGCLKELVSQIFIVVVGDGCFVEKHTFILEKPENFGALVEGLFYVFLLARAWTKGRA